MTIRLAINGFGRIGRNVLRALYTGHYREQLQVVAINDPATPRSTPTCSSTTASMDAFPARSSTMPKACG